MPSAAYFSTGLPNRRKYGVSREGASVSARLQPGGGIRRNPLFQIPPGKSPHDPGSPYGWQDPGPFTTFPGNSARGRSAARRPYRSMLPSFPDTARRCRHSAATPSGSMQPGKFPHALFAGSGRHRPPRHISDRKSDGTTGRSEHSDLPVVIFSIPVQPRIRSGQPFPGNSAGPIPGFRHIRSGPAISPRPKPRRAEKAAAAQVRLPDAPHPTHPANRAQTATAAYSPAPASGSPAGSRSASRGCPTS